MTQHFLYLMDPNAPAPAGTLDTQDWFYRYKRFVEGEVWVPVSPEDYTKQALALPGDMLWFAFLQTRGPLVVGRAEILRVLPPDLGESVELWYPGEAVRSSVMFTAPAQRGLSAGFYLLDKESSDQYLTFL